MKYKLNNSHCSDEATGSTMDFPFIIMSTMAHTSSCPACQTECAADNELLSTAEVKNA
jgi:hypothetical protein